MAVALASVALAPASSMIAAIVVHAAAQASYSSGVKAAPSSCSNVLRSTCPVMS